MPQCHILLEHCVPTSSAQDSLKKFTYSSKFKIIIGSKHTFKENAISCTLIFCPQLMLDGIKTLLHKPKCNPISSTQSHFLLQVLLKQYCSPVVISCASLALADAGIMMYDLVASVSVV